MLGCIFNFRDTPPYECVTAVIGDDIRYMLFYVFALRGQV